MKFLVDECVGPLVVEWLKENKFDAISVYETMQGASDDTVLNRAYQEDRILITSDKDFGEMIFRKRQPHGGIILLRLLDERPANKIQVLQKLLASYANELYGNISVVTEKAVRLIYLRHSED